MIELEKRLKALHKEALEAFKEARGKTAIEEVKNRYLGRKGILTLPLRQTGSLPKEDRPRIGKLANEIKEELLSLSAKLLEKTGTREEAERPEEGMLDVTLPGLRTPRGTIHPITQVLGQMIDIFKGMGFEVAEGPEVELDYYNFSALNFPPNHPARDMQDTFFISDEVVLRTHTSPVQIRTMEDRDPPLRVISPGKVYRCDKDPTHSPMFFQLEGFMVDRKVSIGDLKGLLTVFVGEIFDPGTRLRFRPSFFPFTEPSAEVDISCIFCKGKGCEMCKDSGWLEILGAGMIHPNVLKNVGYDPEDWTGLAFGMGVERIAILKYGISPIHTFFENDLRFLRQF